MIKTLWSCLLSAACIAATTVCMPAQAAPSSGVRVPAQGPEQSERVQRRLAEVIALLEGDDLTAEEQAKARKTLQDIVAQLRNTRTTTSKRTALGPVESGPVEVRTEDGKLVERRRAISSLGGVGGVEVEGETPKARRAKPVEGQRGVYGAEGETPTPAMAPKAPKPQKEGKADAKRYRAGQAPAVPPAPETPKTRRAYVDYEDVERARAGQARAHADAARAHADAAKAYAEKEAHAEALRGKLGVGADRAPVRARSTLPTRVRAGAAEGADEAEIRAMIDEMRKEMREIRSLMQKIRQQANDEDESDPPQSRFYPSPAPSRLSFPSHVLPAQAPGQPSLPSPGLPPVELPGQPFTPSPGLPPTQAPGQPPVPGTPFARLGDGSGFARAVSRSEAATCSPQPRRR